MAATVIITNSTPDIVRVARLLIAYLLCLVYFRLTLRLKNLCRPHLKNPLTSAPARPTKFRQRDLSTDVYRKFLRRLWRKSLHALRVGQPALRVPLYVLRAIVSPFRIGGK